MIVLHLFIFIFSFLASANANNEFRDVTVYNQYDKEKISVFWIDQSNPDDEEGVFMFTLGPTEKRVMNSLDSHMFYAIFDSQENFGERCNPDTITIAPSKNDYYFGDFVSSANSKTETISKYNDGNVLNHPLIQIIGSPTTAMSAIFRCLATKVDYYYDDGKDGSFQGTLDMGKETTSATYEGHVFFFVRHGDKSKSKELARFTMNKDQVVYVIRDSKTTVPANLLQWDKDDKIFREDYFNRTGLLWRHYYGSDGKGPRPPPKLFMWPANHIGEKRVINSQHGFWTCDSLDEQCQSGSSVDMEMQVVSLEPRVFIVEKFLSDFEADYIINYCKSKVKKSIVGSSDGAGIMESDTRTSKNTWLSRQLSQITDTLYRRAADLLNLDEQILHNHLNVEDLQVVNYKDGQKYDSHHDWGVNGHPEDRLITLLLYLTDQVDSTAGGETAFPKGAGGRGFKVSPKRGAAVLFYDLLEDGNGDDLALHAALPVYKGEKWLANFWVWDPKRKD